jgi:3-deoxy-D-manno-octulosonate 8-phosphate phosphatase (KDO 8-P phosphatase)
MNHAKCSAEDHINFVVASPKQLTATEAARDLRMNYLAQGSLNKIEAFDELMARDGASLDEAAFIGDDVTDIPLMRRCGLAIAVADATYETKLAAHYVTQMAGGFGAVREVCELILRAQGRWNELMQKYLC